MLEFLINKMDTENKSENKLDEIKNQDEVKKNQPESDQVNNIDTSTLTDESLKNNENSQPELENDNNQGLIHKKNGRLHIYVRQDKYKGELKSKNWVGRIYFNGKQKIYSSGTPILEDAIPVLEKWFDDIHEKGEKVDENEKNNQNFLTESQETQNSQLISNESEKKNENKENISISASEQLNVDKSSSTLNQDKVNDSSEKTGLKLGMFDKLKNIKLDKLKNINLSKLKDLKLKKNKSEDEQNTGKDKVKKKSLGNIKNLFQSKVSKLNVAGEEIAGLDITREAVRVSQVSGDKDKGWILEKFSYRSLDQEQIKEDILESKDYLANEIELALSNAKITTKNIAMSIPVTSAIIRVVTSPLMSEEELNKAIETDSLWENLVQLGENLNDYSIFHQVINRDPKLQTMDILFVASKLSDINAYSSIAKRAGLNPVIVDVKCFTLKNAYDNTIFKNIDAKNDSTILEIGSDENYIMIIHNNIPIITDIFLRQPEKESINSFSSSSVDAEKQAIIRRYAMQLKQAITDYEGKYSSKINNIQVVSTLKNVNELIPEFKKNLPTVGFHLFNPLEGVSIPSYNTDKVSLENKSPLASVIGLAYRKLDVFGYYKFVTAVKNINLLPNRDAIRQKAKFKFLSGFAFKGLATAVSAFYILLMIFSYFQIQSNKNKLVDFDNVQNQFNNVNSQYSKLNLELNEMKTSLELGKLVGSNQISTYRALAQISRSVPLRVEFTKLTFDGSENIKIEGLAFSDQDILNFINNLNSKKLVKQASLASMKVAAQQEGQTSSNKKGFIINCIIEGS